MMSAHTIDRTKSPRTMAGMVVLIAGVMGLGGCATQREPTSQLQEAKTSYNKVEDNPQAVRSAAESLNRSERELNQAEDLLDSGADTDEVDYHAYLAERYAEIAQNGAKQAALKEQVKKTKERRRALKLKMRKRKAERAEAKANEARKEAEEAKSKQEELKDKLSDLQAKQTKRGVVLTLSDVLFAFDKAELKPGGKQAAKRLARFMHKYPERRIRVEGYTDSTGAETYNRKLSRKRAQAVKDAVVQKGIESSRIVTHGYGEEYPVASNDSDSGRQRNRRVEVLISDEDGKLEARSQESG